MIEFLGSQFGWLILMGIGVVVVYLFNKARNKEMTEEEDNTALWYIVVGAFVIALICYFVS